jgi:hypothetical protein
MRKVRHPECEAAAGSEVMIMLILALRKGFVVASLGWPADCRCATIRRFP